MITGIVIGRIVLVDAEKRSVTMAIGRGCSTVEIGCSSMEEVKQAATMLYETAKAIVSDEPRKRISLGVSGGMKSVCFERYNMENTK
jgi:hypothetical protein